MKINVTFSIFFSPSEAFGNVAGVIELPAIPVVGDTIFFMFSQKAGLVMPQVGFSGMLNVESISFTLGQEIASALDLGHIIVRTKDDARSLMSYFDASFGFFGYEY
jgi:hypothetical protein